MSETQSADLIYSIIMVDQVYYCILEVIDSTCWWI